MAVTVINGTPTAVGTVTNPTAADPYSKAWAVPVLGGNQGAAYEGSCIVATNATLATGIAGHAAPVVADTDTKALFYIFNGSTKYLIMDQLFLEVTAAGTNGTIQYTTVYIDQKGSAARTSGGTAITPVCANTGASVPSGLECYFGAVVTAMSSSRKVGQQIAREVIPVVQDTLLMKFGSSAGGPHAGLTTAGTATNHLVQYFPPVVVAPGGNLNISQIRPSQSAAASYQFEACFYMR